MKTVWGTTKSFEEGLWTIVNNYTGGTTCHENNLWKRKV